jgi:polar amino acid transport system substrate-binding protein
MQFSSRFVLLAVLMLQTSIAWPCTKVMRWNEDPPFSFRDPEHAGQIKGVSVDIARLILGKMNCELTLVEMPWARALLSLQSGDIDIVSGAYNTADRREYAHFSTQANYSPNILYIREADKDIWHLNSLEEIIPTTFRLGVQINVTYSHEYDALRTRPEFEAHLHENSSRNALWHMLNLNRVDGVIADKFTGAIELKKLGMIDKIIATPLIISNAPSYFAFSKKTTQLEFVAAFDEIFSRLQTDGEIEKIETAYLH